MEQIYHEHAEVWAVKQLALGCLSQNISSGVDFITFQCQLSYLCEGIGQNLKHF